MQTSPANPALRALLKVESTAARVFSSGRKPRVIEPFTGYATQDHIILRGRVHSALDRATPEIGQSRIANIRQMLAMFVTREVGGAAVEAGGVTAHTDEEGYFRLELPRADAAGWVTRIVSLVENGASATAPALVPDTSEAPMIISDIDDTVMKTGAYSLARNLWTTFSGNALTRQIFPDAAVLLDRLHDSGAHPVYYVSSSPWNLHYFLNTIFERASVVRGPMFLRDLGLSETKLITSGHGNHKGDSIDTILAANPTRSAILMGDTGQEDAKIYRDAIDRHPGRIRGVVLRTPGKGLDDADRRDLQALRDTGVAVFADTTFAGFQEQIEALMRS